MYKTPLRISGCVHSATNKGMRVYPCRGLGTNSTNFHVEIIMIGFAVMLILLVRFGGLVVSTLIINRLINDN